MAAKTKAPAPAEAGTGATFHLSETEAGAIASAFHTSAETMRARVAALWSAARNHGTDGKPATVRALHAAIKAAPDMPTLSTGTVGNAIAAGEVAREHLGSDERTYAPVLIMVNRAGRAGAEVAIAALARETGAANVFQRADAVAALSEGDARGRADDAALQLAAVKSSGKAQRAASAGLREMPTEDTVEPPTLPASGADGAAIAADHVMAAWEVLTVQLRNAIPYAANMPRETADALADLLAAYEETEHSPAPVAETVAA